MTHQTVNGWLTIRRTVYWSQQAGPVAPADAWLGIAAHRFSPGVREMCCREALHCSFAVAEENLARTAQLSLDTPTIGKIVEDQGGSIVSAQRSGMLRPGFRVGDCTDQTVITWAHGWR